MGITNATGGGTPGTVLHGSRLLAEPRARALLRMLLLAADDQPATPAALIRYACQYGASIRPPAGPEEYRELLGRTVGEVLGSG